MKKRLISVLLTVCLVVALFSCLSVEAAAADTVKYTLKSGDTVYGVCQSLGIDFYANYTWITKTNNIKSYANLKVGTVITLPAPGSKPADTITGGSAVSGSANDKTLLSGDFISGYLITHPMASGETVYSVCSALGIDFYANSDKISKLSGIKSYNRVPVGKLVYLPVTTTPAAGTSCIKIVAHKIVSGDTTYGICNSYGISYTASLSMLKILNNKDNMGAIKAGQLLYLPVPTTIAASSGGSTGGSGGSGSASTSDGKTYSIYTNTTNHGSFEVQVGGKAVTTAVSGTKVTVKATPADNYKLGSISVTKDGASVAAVGADGSFTMPNSNVRISVTFVSGTDNTIYRGSATNGSFKTLVNGAEADKAAGGQTVTIVASPAYGYELDTMKVTYNSGADSVPVTNGSFTMPGNAVKVDVSFKAAAKHALTKGSLSNGSIDFQINGASVSEADSGETVKIVDSPAAGYKLGSVTVAKTGDISVTVPVNNGSFVMPEFDVTVSASFTGTSYTVFITEPSNGTLSVKVNGADTTKAAMGDAVKILAAPADGYEIDKISITKDGAEVATMAGDGTFTMPGMNVRVTVTFKAKT
ncbi:MAG: LysM peptidoglycan-binding domain-containing protein [Oscillospiraceae bacterium]|nr:LysM peptidoglycan-binding domain-containing protein [Oscillospiraceae bacterium]